jgi:hypothetical protein
MRRWREGNQLPIKFFHPYLQTAHPKPIPYRLKLAAIPMAWTTLTIDCPNITETKRVIFDPYPF